MVCLSIIACLSDGPQMQGSLKAGLLRHAGKDCKPSKASRQITLSRLKDVLSIDTVQVARSRLFLIVFCPLLLDIISEALQAAFM